jgi:predicted unusual protein kinase regulating ubiquinone biosynthesis (AarF/ABC1/UbiB family)
VWGVTSRPSEYGVLRFLEVREDLEMMSALAEYLEAKDPEIARLRPTVLVDEFAKMMKGAI